MSGVHVLLYGKLARGERMRKWNGASRGVSNLPKMASKHARQKCSLFERIRSKNILRDVERRSIGIHG